MYYRVNKRPKDDTSDDEPADVQSKQEQKESIEAKYRFKATATSLADSPGYSITIKNISGVNVTCALFQTNPNEQLRPLVWKRASIANGGTGIYSWSLQWGLTWGESQGAMMGGVQFNGMGPVIPRDPSSVASNSADLSYDKTRKKWNIAAATEDKIPPGYLGCSTDTSFTFQDAITKNFCIAVTVEGAPVLALPGQPNQYYEFALHPTYYVALTQEKPGEAVSATAISNATQIMFSPGVFSIDCSINPDGTISINSHHF